MICPSGGTIRHYFRRRGILYNKWDISTGGMLRRTSPGSAWFATNNDERRNNVNLPTTTALNNTGPPLGTDRMHRGKWRVFLCSKLCKNGQHCSSAFTGLSFFIIAPVIGGVYVDLVDATCDLATSPPRQYRSRTVHGHGPQNFRLPSRASFAAKRGLEAEKSQKNSSRALREQNAPYDSYIKHR